MEKHEPIGLREWLEQRGMTIKFFYEKAGIGETTCFRILNGGPITFKTAQKVWEFTGGEVQPRFVLKKKGSRVSKKD